jgi:chromosome segregation ATPase
MNPLVRQIKEHKTTMEKRLETLRRISESRDTLDSRIKELELSMRDTRQQLDTLQQLRHSLCPTPAQRRQAVAQDNAAPAEAAVQ